MKTKGLDRIIIDEDQLQARVSALAKEISADYADKHPLIISVLKGAFYFVADLTRFMTIPVHVDFLAIGQMANVSRDTGIVRITKDLEINISGRHLIMVEDIIDTGLTLAYLLHNLAPRQPASTTVCVLLDNPKRRLVELPIGYRGFTAPDEFLVGYGLDKEEDYRHLPYIATLKSNG